MFGLQEKYDAMIDESMSPENLGVQFIENRFNKLGLVLTANQRLEIKDYYLNSKEEMLISDFTEEQLLNASLSKEDLDNELKYFMDNINLDIIQFRKNLPTLHEEFLKASLANVPKIIFQELEAESYTMLKREKEETEVFFDKVYKVWQKPIDLLQILIVSTRETGESFVKNDFHNSSSICLTENLLVAIHARAIQVSKEVLVLIKHGLADGAEARWRTLHELTVIATFIAEHGDEVAKRYIDHGIVEDYKRAKQHNQYNIRLGASPIDLEEMKLLEEEYLKVIEKYGENYKSDYGWASEILNNKRPTFSAIELSVQFDHYRPYYKLASGNVHAGSHSVFSRLGLLNKNENEDILLCGYSNNGLAVAGQSTALSLVQITTSMLTYNSTMDSLVVCEILRMYADKTNDAFAEVESMMFDYSED